MLLDLQQASSALLLEESLNQTMITEDRIRLFLDQLNEKGEGMQSWRGGIQLILIEEGRWRWDQLV